MTREEAAAAHLTPADGAEGALMREVFARYGEAMYHASALEHGMVNAIIVFDVMPSMSNFTNRQAWEDDFDQAFQKELALPFGVILQRLIKLGRVSPTLVEQLHEAKRRRNRLAHEFFRIHDESVFSIDGKVEMLTECKGDTEFFQMVDNELEILSQPDREKFGITETWVESHFDEAMAQARRRDQKNGIEPDTDYSRPNSEN